MLVVEELVVWVEGVLVVWVLEAVAREAVVREAWGHQLVQGVWDRETAWVVWVLVAEE